MPRLGRTSSSTLWLLFFMLLCLSGSSASAWTRTRNFDVGTFNPQGELSNSTSGAFKLSLSSFFGYFVDEQDVNLGFSIGKGRNPKKKPRQFAWTLDLAPHHIGPGVVWAPTRGKFRYLSYLGAGVGINYTYNTSIKAFELGLKGTFLRW